VWLAIDLGIPIYQCVVVEGTVVLEGVAGLDLPSLPFDHNTERLSPPVTQWDCGLAVQLVVAPQLVDATPLHPLGSLSERRPAG
jgi:hypothetical protein